MPQGFKSSKLKHDVQPDKTLYGPKAVTIKTYATETNTPVYTPPSREVAPGQSSTGPLRMRLSEEPRQGLVSYPSVSAKAKSTGLGVRGSLLQGLGSLSSRIVMLIIALSLAFLIGFGIVLVTAGAIQQINLITAGIVCFVMLGIIIAIITLLPRWVAKPLTKASFAFEALAKGDLTQNIVVEGNDEFAQMMRSMGKTQKSVKTLIRAVDEKAQALSSIGIEMQNMMNDSLEVINKINARTMDMKAKSTGQAEDIAKTNTTMAGIISNIKNLDTGIEEQAESVSRSSASIEEMIANITSITARLTHNEEDLQRLRGASAEGNSSLQKVSGDIQEVAKESERLLEINKVIQGIASQTNLLAMNAAIEAAHAGDVGRGFAVVADEIRKLAESSSKQAKTVSSVLKNVKNALGSISSSTLASLNQFGNIDKGFESVTAQSMEIRKAMEEQDADNKEVQAAMHKTNEIARNVSRNSSEIQNASQELAQESNAFENLTGDLTNTVGEIASGIESIKASLTRSDEISRKSKEDIDNLLGEIKKFSI